MTNHSLMTINKLHGWALCLCLVSLFSGCAAWTNPVANGIPVRMLPPELLVESKDEVEPIPWALLQRSPTKDVLLQPGDVLGLYIEGVLGRDDQLPPVNIPTASNVPPSLGFPIPIRSDGTIPAPLINPPKLAGMTIEAAEKKLIKAYTVDREVLVPDEQRIILTMIRRKHARVLVIRQDSLAQRPQFQPTARGLLADPVTNVNSSQQSRGFLVDIPATEADVLTALAETGGLPGLDAKDEILVYRRSQRMQPNADGQEPNLKQFDVQQLNRLAAPRRIPLTKKKGEDANIREKDVVLEDGDIVVVAVRNAEFYYTGGLLRNAQVPMPLDIDLTVTEAIMRSGGPLINGGIGGGQFANLIIAGGASDSNPSLLTILRKGPNNRRVPIRVDLNEAMRDPREDILIKDGDTLVLQQTTGEAFSRYILGRMGATGTLFEGGSDVRGALTLP